MMVADETVYVQRGSVACLRRVLAGTMPDEMRQSDFPASVLPSQLSIVLTRVLVVFSHLFLRHSLSRHSSRCFSTPCSWAEAVNRCLISGPWIARWQWPAWLNVRRGHLGECDAALRQRIRQLVMKRTFQRVSPVEHVGWLVWSA